LGKPNKLPWTNHTLSCAQYLQQTSQYASDSVIIHIVELQQLAEEVNQVYGMEKALDDRCRLTGHAELFRVRIERWREEVPFDIQEASKIYFRRALSYKTDQSDFLQLRYHAVRVMIYEVGLVHRFGRQRTTVPKTHTQGFSDTLDALNITFQSCVNAAKDYLDCFISTLTPEYHHLPFEEWTRLTLALFVLYKLAIGLPEVPGWDPEMARSTCDLDQYLTNLLNRLKPLPENATASFDTIFHIFPAIMESVKVSHKLACEHPSMFPQGFQTHGFEPDVSTKWNAPTRSYSGCPGFRHLNIPATDAAAKNGTSLNEETVADIRAIENQSM
jgi:hypothetical protein